MAHEYNMPDVLARDDLNLTKNVEKYNNIIGYFKKGFWPPSDLNFGVQSRVPIFIVGFPRSGSTLLESMLASHPFIDTIGEYSIINSNMNELLEVFVKHNNSIMMSNVSSDIDAGSSTAYMDDVSTIDNADKKEIKQMKDYMKPYISYSNERADLIIQRMIDAVYLNRNTTSSAYSGMKSKPTPTHVIDKMLGNYNHIGLIHLLFPKALIINIYRDPMDVLWSCYQRKFSSRHLLYAEHPKTLVKKYSLYLRMMAHWRMHLPVNRIMDVSYESLVASPEVWMRRILSAIRLPFDDAVLRHHVARKDHIAYTASMFQVMKPVYHSSIGVWKKYHPYLCNSTNELSMSNLLNHHFIDMRKEMVLYFNVSQSNLSNTQHIALMSKIN